MDYLLSKHFGIEGKSGVGEKVVRKEGKDFGVRPLRNIGRRTQLQHTIKKSYKTLRRKTRLQQQERTPSVIRSSLSYWFKKSLTPKSSIFASDICNKWCYSLQARVGGLEWDNPWHPFHTCFVSLFGLFSRFLLCFLFLFDCFQAATQQQEKNEEETKKSFVP